MKFFKQFVHYTTQVSSGYSLTEFAWRDAGRNPHLNLEIRWKKPSEIDLCKVYNMRLHNAGYCRAHFCLPESIFQIGPFASISSSTTWRILKAVAMSVKRLSGTSLNNHLLIRPTDHLPLIDVLLWFRWYTVVLTTNVSRMYRTVRLPNGQKNLHLSCVGKIQSNQW